MACSLLTQVQASMFCLLGHLLILAFWGQLFYVTFCCIYLFKPFGAVFGFRLWADLNLAFSGNFEFSLWADLNLTFRVNFEFSLLGHLTDCCKVTLNDNLFGDWLT